MKTFGVRAGSPDIVTHYTDQVEATKRGSDLEGFEVRAVQDVAAGADVTFLVHERTTPTVPQELEVSVKSPAGGFVIAQSNRREPPADGIPLQGQAMNRVTLTTAAAAVAAGAIILLATRGATAQPAGPEMQTIPSASLQKAGVLLSPAIGANTGPAQLEAEAILARSVQGSTVREARILTVDLSYQEPPVHCLCWVFSVALPEERAYSTGGPKGIERRRWTWDVELVDANTGQYVGGVSGFDPK